MTTPDNLPAATTAAGATPLANEVHADPDTRSMSLFAKRLVAETFGTFLLVVVDCGGAV